MTQIALPLNLPAQPLPAREAATAGSFETVGFEIGWDHAHHRLTPPAEHLHGMSPVRQGWEAGRAAFGTRTLKPAPAVQRWLALRLQAWRQGVPFEDVMLSPRYLAQIEATHCPVTREPLSAGDDDAGAAVLMRLDLDSAYAAGNLVMVSRRVLLARGQADASAVAALARRVQEEGRPQLAGLDATQWTRLAALLSLAVESPHAALACRPLAVLAPNRVRLFNPVQALQTVMTQLFLGEAYARRMAALGTLMPDADARRCYFLFMNAMLARRLALGWSAERARVRQGLEDAWLHPVIQRRWEQLALRLRRSDCERIVRLAVQRGLTGQALRWLDASAAAEGWRLECTSAAAASAPGVPQDAQRGSTKVDFSRRLRASSSTDASRSMRKWISCAPGFSV
ncbi:MAG: hypothetical protein JNJ71_14340 [Rubrivivax sp.]|nr:hypothetical protein [Rubrivivax sp.]